MKIGVVGLGYVGLPLAVEFAKKYDVVGFDINEKKVNELKSNIDSTKELTITKIGKVVSGMDEESLNKIADLYGSIITAGVHKAPSIKVAEASKIIENIQRDVNIGIMNEISVIFNKMGIDTFDVIKAARTKWNFNYYHPGLVGGHCIGVDPYYLILKSEELGHHPQLLSSARRINNYMSRQVVEIIVKSLKKSDIPLRDSNVYLLGLTFKENVKDYRNAKSNDVIDYLKSFGINPVAIDPWLSSEEIKEFFDIEKKELPDISDADAIGFIPNDFK